MMSVTLPAETQSDNKYLAPALTLIDLSPQWQRPDKKGYYREKQAKNLDNLTPVIPTVACATKVLQRMEEEEKKGWSPVSPWMQMVMLQKHTTEADWKFGRQETVIGSNAK
ncbi:hypothetical protein GBF38_013159 [Nibea albiflora]|uniref:Uncharacterized protein n=1 Tax=Nibea albiflora TaxID=240163 RepID=A0ACB7EZI2_NIBAL|nr:hypothetical protein GBF38_013159 [Nibea albiflora]